MLRYFAAGLLACSVMTSAASAATIMASNGTSLDEMIFSTGTQTGNTIYGVTKDTGTGITFYSSTSTIKVTGKGYAQIGDANDKVTPWKDLQISLTTDPNGFTAYEFTIQYSSKVVPSTLLVGYDLLSGGPTQWFSPINFTTSAAKDFQILAGKGEIFSKIYLSSNDPITQIKQNDITLAPTSAVPEPASWMTMIAGFGLVGMSFRQRRRSMNRTELA
jgi:hypothetical protein